MRKKAKKALTYFAVVIIASELGSDLLLHQNPSHWAIARLILIAVNISVIVHLLNLHEKKLKLKAQKAEAFA
jgi:hypothetical protein